MELCIDDLRKRIAARCYEQSALALFADPTVSWMHRHHCADYFSFSPAEGSTLTEYEKHLTIVSNQTHSKFAAVILFLIVTIRTRSIDTCSEHHPSVFFGTHTNQHVFTSSKYRIQELRWHSSSWVVLPEEGAFTMHHHDSWGKYTSFLESNVKNRVFDLLTPKTAWGYPSFLIATFRCCVQ